MDGEYEVRKVPPFPSRALVLAAANMLKVEGHAGFNSLRLEWDLPDTNAGEGSGLAARATSLATFAFQEPQFRTPDGYSLQSVIVERAGEHYRAGTTKNISEKERQAFKRASESEGSMNDVTTTDDTSTPRAATDLSYDLESPLSPILAAATPTLAAASEPKPNET